MLDLIREIAQTLRNNKLRTILTGISVAWGIFMLIILLGAARGVTNSFEQNIGSSVSKDVEVYGGWTTLPFKGYKDGRAIQLKESDRSALMREHPGKVSKVVPFASNDTAKISTSRDVLTDGFSAVYPEAETTEDVTMKYGRFINDLDIDKHRRVMVIHENNAALLFPSAEEALGKTVSSMGLAWTVVGIYEHRWRQSSFAPYTTFKAITGNNDDANQLNVSIEGMKTEADADQAEEDVRRTLAHVHQFDPNDRSAVWTWSAFGSYIRAQQAGGYLQMAVWIIGILTLLTGIVGVSNIMFVSVRERTHEIGIRRAIGAKPRSILTQILAESVALTAIFGYIGVFFGMAILQLVDYFVGDSTEGFVNPTVDISIAIKVTVALVVAGALAGLFPALKAIKVKPVEALSEE